MISFNFLLSNVTVQNYILCNLPFAIQFKIENQKCSQQTFSTKIMNSSSTQVEIFLLVSSDSITSAIYGNEVR